MFNYKFSEFKFADNLLRLSLASSASVVCLLMFSNTAFAQPYGVGLYGSNVPFGGQTSLTIATSGNVSIPISPSSGSVTASGTNNVTVTSSDVVGYKLYLRSSATTDLTNGGNTIPASSNASPASLATNSWGYNTDGSSNYTGPTLSDVLIRTGTGPFVSGDVTTVYFAVKIDNTQPAGNYSGTITYTAIPQTD